MGIFDLLKKKQKPSTAAVAKERLQIIVAHERKKRTEPDYLPMTIHKSPLRGYLLLAGCCIVLYKYLQTILDCVVWCLLSTSLPFLQCGCCFL